MDFTLALVIATVAIALFFDYTNGFHDAANAIATSVSTRALTPRLALTMAAILNFVGALLGVEVAKTIKDILTGFDTIDSAEPCPHHRRERAWSAPSPGTSSRGTSASRRRPRTR